MAGIRDNLPIMLIVTIISIIGTCLNENSTTVVNDFLINNWKMYYHSADANHDGKLSIEDAQECVKRLVEMEHLDVEGKKSFEKYWDECLLRGLKGNISEQEFVDSLTTDFNADIEKFMKEVDICYYTTFKRADINLDHFIDDDELNAVIGAFEDNDVLFPDCDIFFFWVGFLSQTDESKGNITQN